MLKPLPLHADAVGHLQQLIGAIGDHVAHFHAAEIVWDRAEVWVAVEAEATLEIGVAGSRTSFSPATGSVQKLTYAAPGAAEQVLELARVTGPVRIIGWHCYDSTSPGLDVLNCGRTSWRTDQYADQSAYHSPLSALPSLDADLWLVQLGLNDFNQNRSPSDYQASLTAIVDRAAAIGVPVVLIVSMSPGVSRDHPWQAYADVIRSLGAERNLPVLDVGVRFGPFVEGAASGFIADTLHPNAYGYAETARLIYNLLNL
ncbi:SGNH/GDSL hydrolase family protein [Paracoccus caeni]|uniref:SGNH/GDSL hydrolase family protein n=1 Tax=Paracoccus caeni TaxID=657651 RepID=UPI002D803F6E|nr:SGNH/GDSL hydrolase family protein [Paracoccus caeni]